MKIFIVPFLITMSLSRPSLGGERVEAPSGTVWVHVEKSKDVPYWKVKAVEETIWQNLSSFERITLADSISSNELKCASPDFSCIFKEMRHRGVDIVILGRLRENEVDFKVFETWTGAEVTSKVFPLQKNSMSEFRHSSFRLIKPFVEIGGLLDQWKKLPPKETQVLTVGVAPQKSGWLVLILVIPLMVLFWVPRMYFTWVAHIRNLKWTKTKGYFVSWTATLILPLSWVFLNFFEVQGPIPIVLRFLLGGIFWGITVILFHHFVIPTVRGLERITTFALPRLLATFFVLFILKGGLVLMGVAPFLAFSLWFGHVFQASLQTFFLLVVPGALILGALWYLIWVELFTLYLDKHYLSSSVDDKNPWHQEIKKYLRGYLNRLTLELDENLLQRCLFLPARGETNITYGGGFLRPRIVLSSWTLPFALGPLPEKAEESDDDGFIDYTKSIFGPRRRQKKILQKTFFQRVIDRVFDHEGDKPSRHQIGRNFNLHNSTILGFVVPLPTQQAVPLISNNREDYEVVEELLKEHYSQFSKGQDDHELDDTDPTDKDFLFGGLLREIAVLENRNQFVTTLFIGFSMTLRRFLKKLPPFLAKIYGRYFSGFFHTALDAYAALNLGRNHLVQYLYYLMVGRRQQFTARAETGALYAQSQQIIQTVAEMSIDDKESREKNILKKRIMEISELYFGTALEGRKWPVILGRIMALLLIGAFGYGEIHRSLSYHSVYVNRIAQMKKKIEEKERQNQEQKNGRFQ